MDFNKNVVLPFILLVIILIIVTVLLTLKSKKRQREENITESSSSDSIYKAILNDNIHLGIISWLLYANKKLKKLITQQVREFKHSNATNLYNLFDSMDKQHTFHVLRYLCALYKEYRHLEELKKNSVYDILNIYKAIIDSLIEDCSSSVQNDEFDNNAEKINQSARSWGLQTSAQDIKNNYYIQFDSMNIENNNLMFKSSFFNLMMSSSSYDNQIVRVNDNEEINSHVQNLLNTPNMLNIFISENNRIRRCIYDRIKFYDVKYQLVFFVEHNYKSNKNHYTGYTKIEEDWYKIEDIFYDLTRMNNMEMILNRNMDACLLIYTKF